MNEIITKAVVVYVPKQEKSFCRRLLSYISNAFGQAFISRKRYLFIFFSLYVFSMFLGCCYSFVSFSNSLILPSYFNGIINSSLHVFCILMLLSGLTVFGRITPFLFILSSSFVTGVFLYRDMFLFAESYISVLLSVARLSIASFAVIILSVEIFFFSKLAFVSPKAMLSVKRLSVYLSSCIGVSTVLVLLFYSL